MGIRAEELNPKYYYSRHEPEKTVLYQIIQNNLATFLEQVESEKQHPLPKFVIKEFYDYLDCGILTKGFLRLHCESCGANGFVAFSCKRRGFCPSCGGRRMNETALHLMDSVLPHQRIRQWVMSYPIPLRLILAIKPKIMSKALRVVTESISNYYRNRAGLSKEQSQTGAVTLIQRFGGSINLNVHFHSLFIDGVYEVSSKNGDQTIFYPIAEPSVEELYQVLEVIIKETLLLLEKEGLLIKENEDSASLSLDTEDDDVFSHIQSSSVQYRYATGPNKGKIALSLKSVPKATKVGLVAERSGFSLHAGVAISDRKKLEKLARYIARPPIAVDRLRLNEKGQVVYELKKPYSDGTSYIVMSQLELLEKITAIIPRPNVHLTRYHGVLAPNSKYRSQIVPEIKNQQQQQIDEDQNPDFIKNGDQQKSRRNSWARLLKRVFQIDVEKCGACGGKVKIIAAIKKKEIIQQILGHLGLPSVPPEIAPSRGPPAKEYDHCIDDEFYNDSYNSPDYDYT